MAETAENLAEQYRITAQAVDAMRRGARPAPQAAWDAGAFADEVVPVPIPNRKTKQTEAWAADEHMRPDTTPEALAKLPPYFKKDGVVTAGNASGICDGAAALVLAERQFACPAGTPAARAAGRLGAAPAWSPAHGDRSGARRAEGARAGRA